MIEHTAMFTATVRDANRGTSRLHLRTMAANRDLAAREEELWLSRRRIVDVADEQRRRIERDIHDGAQQRLVSASLQLQLAAVAADAGETIDREQLDEIRLELAAAVDQLRALASGVFPSILADQGLAKALHSAARLTPRTVELDIPDDLRVNDSVARSACFICVEAPQNSGKHAGLAATVRVTLQCLDGKLQIRVSDDGAGFDSAGTPRTRGLLNMADRASAEGETFEISSVAGVGTTIAADLPTASPA